MRQFDRNRDLRMFVIYTRPRDMPAVPFVVRGHTLFRDVQPLDAVPDAIAMPVGSLREARMRIPWGMTNIGRQPDDEPHIVEVWI